MTYYLAYQTRQGKWGRYRIGRDGSLNPVQARDIALSLAADVAHGKDVHAEKVKAREEMERAKARTLRVFLDTVFAPWFKEHQSRTTDTVRKVKTTFADLLSKPMDSITPWWMEKWRTERRKAGIAVTTLNREAAALKAVLSRAAEWGYLDQSPLARGKLKPLRADDNGKIRYLSPDEEKRLRATLDARESRIREGRASANEWRRQRGYASLPSLWGYEFADYLKPMVLLSLNTGLRRGEVFKLTWVNVNFHTRTLTVEGKIAKSGKTRHVPLNIEALEVLRKWKTQGTGTDLVFPGKDGAPMDNVQTSWEGLLKDAGITEFRWHDLRHSFASKLVMAGVDLNTVRELLGHADIKMALRYAHLAPEHKAEAVARLCAA
jgi:integrase